MRRSSRNIHVFVFFVVPTNLTSLLFSCQSKNAERKFELVSYDSCANIPDDTANYPEYCRCAEKNALAFPTADVVSAIIYPNVSTNLGEFIAGQPVDAGNAFVREFRSICADSANFEWGEIGTVHDDYEIDFLDGSGKIINRAAISYDGMIDVTPNLKTTKWGKMSHDGENRVRELITRYMFPG